MFDYLEKKHKTEEYNNLLTFVKTKVGSKVDDAINESMQADNVSYKYSYYA